MSVSNVSAVISVWTYFIKKKLHSDTNKNWIVNILGTHNQTETKTYTSTIATSLWDNKQVGHIVNIININNIGQ